MTPQAVARSFEPADFPWWLAGGYALELFAGFSWRDHGDIDVLILRRDQSRARTLLESFDCWAADPPGRLRAWPVGEWLPPGVHDIFCREDAAKPWQLQLMIDESEDEEWVSRRDARIRRNVADVGLVARDIPILAPEVQLYYKAKARRVKDEQDFAVVLPLSSTAQRDWLSEAIGRAYGLAHSWRVALTQAPDGSR